jgi:hypothetical protein
VLVLVGTSYMFIVTRSNQRRTELPGQETGSYRGVKRTYLLGLVSTGGTTCSPVCLEKALKSVRFSLVLGLLETDV